MPTKITLKEPTTEDLLYNARENNKKLKQEIKKYKQALEEIKEDLEQDTTCESRECGCDDYGECLKCVKETILDKIKEVLNDRD